MGPPPTLNTWIVAGVAVGMGLPLHPGGADLPPATPKEQRGMPSPAPRSAQCLTDLP